MTQILRIYTVRFSNNVPIKSLSIIESARIRFIRVIRVKRS